MAGDALGPWWVGIGAGIVTMIGAAIGWVAAGKKAATSVAA